MKRTMFLLYSVFCYIVFLAMFLWSIAFIGSFAPLALLIDLALLTLFGVQHSVMARARFKRWWTRIVPRPIERSTYVLLSSLAMLLLFWQRRPLPGALWSVEQPLGRLLLWGLCGLG